jgi:Family of unknown function (DUF5695)
MNTMYRTIILISGAMLLFGCSSQPGSIPDRSENIIINPGFELGDKQPADWEEVTVQVGARPEFDWKVFPEGRTKAAGLILNEAGVGGWKQTVNLDPDGEYRLSAKVKTGNIDGRGLGAAVLFPRFRWMKPLSTRDAPEWQRYSVDITNAGFTRLDLLCALGINGLNTGTVYFDDIELKKYPNPALNPAETASLEWETMQIRYHRKRGYITSLKPGTQFPDAPEYIASHPTLPYLDPSKDHFLGDMSLDILDGQSWRHVTTADPDSNHKVKAGKEGLTVVHSFKQAGIPVIRSEIKPTGRELLWRISLENTSSREMVVGSLELPLPWNNNYCLFDPHDKASQKLLYTRRVAEHKHIGGNASYVLVCPMDGKPPHLMIHPAEKNTDFEFAYHAVDTIRNQRRDEGRWIHGAWPGLTRLCLVSKAVMEQNKWADWLNPHTRLVVPAKETKTFTLTLRWLDHRNDVPETMGNASLLGFRVIPSLALPTGYPSTVIVYGATPPLTVSGVSKWQISPGFDQFNGTVLVLELDNEGPQTVEITDAENRSGRLFMYGLPAIRDLMLRRSRFILDNQVFSQADHPLDGAILCFNNRIGKPLVDGHDMWGSGGYEGGITDAMFLALKNTQIPDQKEIRFLEKYISQWVLKRLQDPQDYGVAWTVSRPDRKERGYNYIHVLNLYDAMARGAAVWPELYEKKVDDYLDLWWNTFNAFRHNQVRFQDLGLMGRGNITFMPELLRRFDFQDRAESVEAEIQMWGKYWSEEPAYPFGSELFFDNTGYESIFFYRDYIKEKSLAQQVLNVTKAGRGRAPCWFWNDSDQRWWDAVRTAPKYESFTDFGENCHHYMTGLNGYMLLEAFDRGYGRDEPGPIGYSGIWNSWARVNQSGFAGMCYCPDPASDNYGLNQFTGDVGLGLWGSVKAFRCYIVDDPILKRTVYGGTLIEDEEQDGITRIAVNPAAGVDHKIRWIEYELFVDSEGPVIREMVITPDKTRLELYLENPTPYRCDARIIVTGLPRATYEWETRSQDGKKTIDIQTPIQADKDPLTLTMPFEPGVLQVWQLIKTVSDQ